MSNISIDEILPEVLEMESTIPETKPLREDIFTISGFPHYETVLSNWFGYFLNSENGHGFTGLFSETFRSIIQKKSDKFSLDWLNDQVNCIQEVQTKKGNFIDLVVFDERAEGGKGFEDALVIEHKVYADLYNDLPDYFQSIESSGEKLGVVLSAKELTIPDPNFIGITYKELFDELIIKLGKYALEANMIQLGYLRDFLNNIDRMSETKNQDALKFCFEHGSTIEKILSVREQAENDLVNSVRLSLEPSNYDFYRKNPSSFSIRSNTGSAVIYIQIGHLFSERKCDIQYWLQGESVQKWNRVPDHRELKDKFDPPFEIREKKEAKEWAEIFRGKWDLSHVENIHEIFDVELRNYLQNEIDPVHKFIMSQIEKYTS
ncbi:MAG: PD-(D/E)XK nuclease family protein [Cyclobacteriaceae bacterium]